MNIILDYAKNDVSEGSGNMKEHLNRLLAIILALMLLSADVCAIAEAAVLTLPSDLQVIEEEAFCGDTSISKVIVPDGTTEIRSRAFANSSLTELILPDSLTFIAENALDGCGEVTITVPKNCYAYDRCVALNLIPDTSFRAQIACSAVESSVGESVTWTGTALYGTAPHKYLFKLYRGEELLETRAYTTSPTYTYTFTKAGDYHVELSVKDDDREVASVRSAIVTVGLEELVISELSCNQETVCVAETPTWTVTATGGQAPYSYAFVLIKDGATIAEQAYSANAAFSYEFAAEGNYTLKATVKDSLGTESAAYKLPVSVAPQPVTIISLESNITLAQVIEDDITWTVTAVGGVKPLSYAFELYFDGEEMGGCEPSEDNTFTITPDMLGVYSVKALVYDANNATQSFTGGEVIALEGEGSPISDFTFNALDAEYCEITGYIGTDTVVILPKTDEEGRIVQRIAENAFKNNADFYYVVIPDSVEFIDDKGFYGCRNLQSLICGANLTNIGENAFYNCSALNNVSLPDGLKTIGRYAFRNCTGLKSIHLPDSLKTISGWAFYGCSNLSSVNYPTSWTSVGTYRYSPFCNCPKLTKIVVPKGVTKIPYWAFDGMTSLKSISLPNTLTEISSSAFYGCTGLTSISLPDGLKTIGEETFSGCTSLTSIYLPDSLKTIGGSAFYGCSSLSSVNYPTGLTTVDGISPFRNCPKLTSIVVPEGVTVIPDYAFDGVTSLTSIKLPSTLTEIGFSTFSGCTGLTSISLPDSLKTIGADAFCDCSNLSGVNYPANWRAVTGSTSPFRNCPKLTSIVVPEDAAEIPKYAFDGVTSLTSIELPSGLVEIGVYAFRGCTSLTSISLPDGLGVIGTDAFYGCSNLSSVSYPESWALVVASNYFYSPFRNCPKLTSIVVPEGVTQIPDDAFSGMASLTSISLPSTLTEIGCEAFGGCTGLTSISLPDGLETIGADAFIACTNLSSINYPLSWTTVNGEYSPFGNCPKLTHIVVPEGVTKIPDYAFCEVEHYLSIDLPSSLTEIGSRAFEYCTGLTSISLPEGLKTICSGAFSGCTGLTSIYLPSSLTEIEEMAFTDLSEEFTIYGEAGSYAETYAKNNSIPFIAGKPQ